MKTPPSIALRTFFTTGCLALLLLVPQARATTIIYDDFTAANGTVLDGRVTPVGGVTWTSYEPGGGIAEIENNGVTVSAQTGAGYFSVPYSVGSATAFEIDVNVWPHGNNLNLSFATSSAASQNTTAMTLWGAINSFGGWGLYQGTTLLGGGGGVTAGSTSYGDASLAYNVTTSTLTFTVGGVQLYSGVVSSFNPADITTAGISYNNISNDNTNPEVTSFAVVAVPEPSSVALLCAGMGVVALAKRRRLRK